MGLALESLIIELEGEEKLVQTTKPGTPAG